MPGIPSRDTFAALTAAATAIAPVAMLGFVRRKDPNSLSVPYEDDHGIGGHILGQDDGPQVLRLPAAGPRHGPADRFLVNRSGAVESHQTFVGVQYLVALPVPGLDTETLLWIGLRRAESVTPAEMPRFQSVAQQAAAMLSAPEPASVLTERLSRLELTAELLPER